MYKFENNKLGIDDDEVQISTSEEHQLGASMMAQQCKRDISIISRELDPEVYDAVEFVDSVKTALLAHRRSRMRIIVFKPQLVASRGHLLLDLAANLPSYIELRKAGNEHKGFNESLFVADNTGYVYRNSAERFDGTLNFNGRRKSKILMDVFEEMWNRSTPDPNLRRMSL
jgi:hypothetical protein